MEKEKRYKKKDFVKGEWLTGILPGRENYNNLNIVHGSLTYTVLVDAGILEAWFEEIKEPEEIKYVLKARHSDNQTDIIISSMGFKYPKDGTIVSYENLNGLYNSIIQLSTSIPRLTTMFSTVDIGCLHNIYLQDIKELLSVYKSNFIK